MKKIVLLVLILVGTAGMLFATSQQEKEAKLELKGGTAAYLFKGMPLNDIAAAYNSHFPRAGDGSIGTCAEVVCLHEICPSEVFVSAINTDKGFALDSHKSRQPRPNTNIDRIKAVFFHQLLDSSRPADNKVTNYFDTHLG